MNFPNLKIQSIRFLHMLYMHTHAHGDGSSRILCAWRRTWRKNKSTEASQSIASMFGSLRHLRNSAQHHTNMKINILSNSVFVLSKRCLIYGFIEKGIVGARRRKNIYPAYILRRWSKRDRKKFEGSYESFLSFAIYFVRFIVESFSSSALNIFLLCRKSFFSSFLLTSHPHPPTTPSIGTLCWEKEGWKA